MKVSQSYVDMFSAVTLFFFSLRGASVEREGPGRDVERVYTPS